MFLPPPVKSLYELDSRPTGDVVTPRVMWLGARGTWSSVTLLAVALCHIIALGEGFIATSPLLRWYKFCRSPGDELVNVLRDRSWSSHHRSRDYSKITLTQAYENADVQELRLLTWMEVESRIQRDIEHVSMLHLKLMIASLYYTST